MRRYRKRRGLPSSKDKAAYNHCYYMTITRKRLTRRKK